MWKIPKSRSIFAMQQRSKWNENILVRQRANWDIPARRTHFRISGNTSEVNRAIAHQWKQTKQKWQKQKTRRTRKQWHLTWTTYAVGFDSVQLRWTRKTIWHWRRRNDDDDNNSNHNENRRPTINISIIIIHINLYWNFIIIDDGCLLQMNRRVACALVRLCVIRYRRLRRIYAKRADVNTKSENTSQRIRIFMILILYSNWNGQMVAHLFTSYTQHRTPYVTELSE